jgi:hypothetical protein
LWTLKHSFVEWVHGWLDQWLDKPSELDTQTKIALKELQAKNKKKKTSLQVNY